MSFEDSLKSFSRRAGQVRVKSFSAYEVWWHGKRIDAIIRQVDSFSQESGGYERGGEVRCETIEPLKVYDTLLISGIRYVVTAVNKSDFWPTITATLEVRP